jgi:hypothetical protein
LSFGTTRRTVILWRQRLRRTAIVGNLEHRAGPRTQATYDSDKIAAIVEATLPAKPAKMMPWSCRTMAHRESVSKSTIHNIWQAHDLQPHRVETFKLSRDKKLLENRIAVMGLYLNPPQQAIALCVDEKSRIHAPDRTQAGLASWLNLVDPWFGAPGCTSRRTRKP